MKPNIQRAGEPGQPGWLPICPVCHHTENSVFWRVANVPVHQNVLIRERIKAMVMAKGDMRMAICRRCGFVFNAAFEPSMLEYGPDYDSTQSRSFVFATHLDQLAQYLSAEVLQARERILDIGCGDGSFLRRLVAAQEGRHGHGIDPAYRGSETDLNGRLSFSKAYYTPDSLDFDVDFVILRHVLEHTRQPLAILNGIRRHLSQSGHGRLFIETPDVEWILRNGLSWNFFYEYHGLFGRDSLSAALRLAGFEVEHIQSVFGGQYLWVEAALPDTGQTTPADGPQALLSLAAEFQASAGDELAAAAKKIAGLATRGKLALWGAGAKGVMLANLLDPDARVFDCVVDINPRKQGGYIPGTGHAIVPYEALSERGIAGVVLTNRNYEEEICQLLNGSGLSFEVIVV